MEKYKNSPLFHPSTFVMLWTCTFCRFWSKLDFDDVDNLSMLTAFFPLCCVIRWKMTCRIRWPSGAMLYPCKKVSVLTAMAEGEVEWVSFLSTIRYSVEVSVAYVIRGRRSRSNYRQRRGAGVIDISGA